MSLIRKHVFVTGKVQNVGFRLNARHQARELGLTGWVRNLPDRRLELCFQGEQGIVSEMEDWCRVGPPCARVMDISISDVPPVEDEASFEIL